MIRKLLPILGMSFLFIGTIHAQDDSKRFKELVLQLDHAMDNRDIYQSNREERIGKMKSVLYDGNASMEEIMDAYDLIFREYCSYQLDSAIHYALLKKELAMNVGNKGKAIEAQLNFAEALANAGMNTDLDDALNEIPVNELDTDQFRYYLLVRSLLFENLDSQTTSPILSPKHRKSLYDTYMALDTLQTPENSGYRYYHIRAKILSYEGRHEDARRLLENEVDIVGMKQIEKASYYYRLGKTYEDGAGTIEEAKCCYVLSALTDMQDADKEHFATYKLAMILYGEGDIKRAYRYLSVSMEDAHFSNSLNRLHRIFQMLPVIDHAYNEAKNRQQFILNILLAISVLLIITLIGTLIYVGKLYRRNRVVTRRLSIMYNNLKELTDNLHESNMIKEAYIVRYMNLYNDSMNQSSLRLKRIAKLIYADNEKELRRMLDTSSLEKENLDIFYSHFDATFLNLFPTFIEEYNRFLKPGSQTVPKKPNRLNTELRIYALIRLGITDNSKIAELLHCSISTIYNNRFAARSKAVDHDRFEENMANIGKAKLHTFIYGSLT